MAEGAILFKKDNLEFFFWMCIFFLTSFSYKKWQSGILPHSALNWKASAPREVLSGLFIGIGCASAAFTIALGSHLIAIETYPSFLPFTRSFIMLSFGVLLTSLSEDILTRVIWYDRFQKQITPSALIFLTTLLYSLNHIYRYNDGWLVWTHLILIGLIFGTTLVQKRTIWFSFGIHWGLNIIYQVTNNIIQTREINTSFSGFHILVILEAILLLFLLLIRNQSQNIKQPITQ
ncbi:CPBP family intramembrane metalloprotease [Flavihumibacter rivuli]|uniref:CPBP family intramembrane glutamic endopeptidase n=1 Tax=Flavihumibacter rivuli TaxID=2838156 RepID=UPI001BDE67F4|nr:CPBP family intramembrane glutamic endopeptidase [Flavihumibacter rivuli]ULQ58236.1 CPBP family intramembrane metalloprotease [Flavihumibacter rivuli]